MGGTTGLTLVMIFNLEGVEAGAIFLPHFHSEVQRRPFPERVAGLVVCSTALNFACLPLLISAAIFLADP